jgi:hypothetical protein
MALRLRGGLAECIANALTRKCEDFPKRFPDSPWRMNVEFTLEQIKRGARRTETRPG